MHNGYIHKIGKSQSVAHIIFKQQKVIFEGGCIRKTLLLL